MMLTSSIVGTLEMRVVPGASKDAAINFKTEFFAPDTSTDPTRRSPPSMRNHCTRASYERGGPLCLRVVAW